MTDAGPQAADLAQVPEPTRQVWHFGLLVVFLFAVIASHLLGARPLMVAPFNNVATAGPLPAALVTGLGEDDWGAVIHRSDWSPPLAALLGHTRAGQSPRLGWAVREWSILTLPVAGWRQSDVSIVTEDAYGYKLTGMIEPERQALARRSVGWLPWWRFAWGWPVIALFVGFVWGELRWQSRRRALLGLI